MNLNAYFIRYEKFRIKSYIGKSGIPENQTAGNNDRISNILFIFKIDGLNETLNKKYFQKTHLL